MNKNELLRKAKEENKKKGADERQLQLASKSSAIAFTTGLLLCLAVGYVSTLFEGVDLLVSTSCWVIWSGMNAANFLLRGVLLREKPFMLAGAAMSFFFACFVWSFVKQLMVR
ncbi:MAG: hypothetical protein IKI64_04765 [Clostridia bacterium]|nr:hypothetical protein [Clostridia bacterium]